MSGGSTIVVRQMYLCGCTPSSLGLEQVTCLALLGYSLVRLKVPSVSHEQKMRA